MEFNKQNILNKVKEAQQSTVVMDEGLRAYMLKVTTTWLLEFY